MASPSKRLLMEVDETQEADHHLRLGQNKGQRQEILHPFPPRVVVMNVYATPYAFTPSNEPLYLRYGTVAAAEAADAAYYLISTSGSFQNNGPGVNKSHLNQQSNNIQETVHGIRKDFHVTPETAKPLNLDPVPSLSKESDYIQNIPDEKDIEYKIPFPESGTNDRKMDLPDEISTLVQSEFDQPKIKKSIEPEDSNIGFGVDMKQNTTDRNLLKRNRDYLVRDSYDKDLDMEGDTSSKRSRMVWSVELHSAFLKAIEKISLNKAVPTTILNEMQSMQFDGITRDHVASHLQKHRQSIQKEKESKERNILWKVLVENGKEKLVEKKMAEEMKDGCPSSKETKGRNAHHN